MSKDILLNEKKELEGKLVKYSSQLRELYQKNSLEKYKGECDAIMTKFNETSLEIKQIEIQLKN